MLAMYEWFLAQDVSAGSGDARRGAEVDRRRIDAELASGVYRAVRSSKARARKWTSSSRVRDGARCACTRSQQRGPALRERIGATLVPAATMEQWLAACGAASHPADLAVPIAKLARDYRRARLIRRRYTILDCLEDLGWLDAAIQSLFASDGFWGRRARPVRTAAAISVS